MKKMKLFLMMFIAAASVCGFVSCDDDDDKSSASSIVGTWEYREPGFVDSYTFSADGSYTNSYQEDGYGSGYDRGTYTYEGTTLTLKSATYGEVDVFYATISGDKLTIDGDVYIRK